jgi:hypothetical protein
MCGMALKTIDGLEQGSEMVNCRNDLEGSQAIQSNWEFKGKYSLLKKYSLTLLRNFSKARTRIKLETNYLNYAT